MEKEKIEKIINNYNCLDKTEKEKVDRYIKDLYCKIHEEYVIMCEQDEELLEAFDKLKEAEKIISFNLEDYFQEYSHTINEFDPEVADRIYVYSPEKFYREKHIAENLDALLLEINKEIKDLETRKLVLFREYKIEKLKSKISEYERIADSYKRLMEQQEKKEYYLKNEETLVAPYKNIYLDRTEKYAKETVDKHLDSDAIIFCKNHTSSWGSSAHRGFSSKPFNNALNKVREEVLFGIKQKNEVNIER